MARIAQLAKILNDIQQNGESFQIFSSLLAVTNDVREALTFLRPIFGLNCKNVLTCPIFFRLKNQCNRVGVVVNQV